MKVSGLKTFSTAWTILLLLALAGLSEISRASSTQPNISSIRLEKTEVIVTAQVPAGIKKVTLEGRSRVGAGTWIPRAVARLDGNGGEFTFRLKLSAQLELLRVR